MQLRFGEVQLIKTYGTPLMEARKDGTNYARVNAWLTRDDYYDCEPLLDRTGKVDVFTDFSTDRHGADTNYYAFYLGHNGKQVAVNDKFNVLRSWLLVKKLLAPLQQVKPLEEAERIIDAFKNGIFRQALRLVQSAEERQTLFSQWQRLEPLTPGRDKETRRLNLLSTALGLDASTGDMWKRKLLAAS